MPDSALGQIAVRFLGAAFLSGFPLYFLLLWFEAGRSKEDSDGLDWEARAEVITKTHPRARYQTYRLAFTIRLAVVVGLIYAGEHAEANWMRLACFGIAIGAGIGMSPKRNWWYS